MNKFEIELANVKSELGNELLRIDQSILGLRRDYNRRIVKIMAEYNEKKNHLDTQHLDIKLKLNAMTDMKGRLALMNLMAENERNQRYYKESNAIKLKGEKGEMAVCIGELEIQKRRIRQDMELRMAEINERYFEWLEARKQNSETPTTQNEQL